MKRMVKPVDFFYIDVLEVEGIIQYSIILLYKGLRLIRIIIAFFMDVNVDLCLFILFRGWFFNLVIHS